jgi:hypothetical protein
VRSLLPLVSGSFSRPAHQLSSWAALNAAQDNTCWIFFNKLKSEKSSDFEKEKIYECSNWEIVQI